jgi:hypothetical protein
MLDSHERAILDDSYDRPTSDELFYKVRGDVIDLYATNNSVSQRSEE